jgi:hypothetical protein
MNTQTQEYVSEALQLSDPFEDLTGIIRSDLKVIVNALTDRAGERLLLSPRQRQQLKHTLWNNLTHAINETMEPLTYDRC